MKSSAEVIKELSNYQDDDKVTIKFPVIAGALIRGQIRSFWEQFRWNTEIPIQWIESKGFLESRFDFKCHCTVEEAKQIQCAYDKMVKYYM